MIDSGVETIITSNHYHLEKTPEPLPSTRFLVFLQEKMHGCCVSRKLRIVILGSGVLERKLTLEGETYHPPEV